MKTTLPPLLARAFLALLACALAVVASAPAATVRTFQNTLLISINDSASPPTPASPYPSQITVPGGGGGATPLTTVTKVQVKLFNFQHTFPADVDLILVGPGGQRVMLMSDAGGGTAVNSPGADLLFSATAATALPGSSPPALTTGTFRPANYAGPTTTDTFSGASPAPGALTDAPTDLGVFHLANPDQLNGTWRLYVVDDANGDAGQIAQGWDLILTEPAVFTVSSVADAGTGTLREAITLAQDGDLINFSPLFNTPQTIALLTALPDLTRSVTIQGPGANLLTVRRDFNAATEFRIFNIAGGVANGVHLGGMTITGGIVSGDFGGGISSESWLFLNNVHVTGNRASGGGGGVSMEFIGGVFTNCTFSNNLTSGGGGGISLSGGNGQFLRLINSTVSGNVSTANGGGINNASFGGDSRLEITHSTIANNTAAGSGGGLRTSTSGAGSTATTTLRNTIVTGNSPTNLAALTFSGGGAATFQTLGFNLSDNYGPLTPAANDLTSATPRLAPLALYGGQTPTHALLHGSPAINVGDASGFPSDQRGQIRLLLPGTADIGSVEMRPLIVSNTNNAGGGSLSQAVTDANSLSDLNDILFDQTVFAAPQTITLSGELPINSNLNLIGPGADRLIVSGGGNSRVFNLNTAGMTATLSGMTISGGNTSGSGGGVFNRGHLTVTHSAVSGNATSVSGGGIRNNSTGTLTVTHSTISGNTSTATGFTTGGGIDNAGRLTVTHSTISGNTSEGGTSGGGISITSTGTANITNSTITNNRGVAGGIYSDTSGTVTIRNSIVAANFNNPEKPDVTAFGGTGITSNGFNLIGNRGNVTFGATGDLSGDGASPLPPGLAALASNGGPTPTHALLSGSQALDAGQSSGALVNQRGSPRAVNLPVANAAGGDGADIGALEAQTEPPLPTISVNDTTIAEGDPATFTITLSAASGDTVTLTYNTTGGTATADVDYNNQNSPATLTFAPGTTTQTVSVPTFEDFTFEPDETFNLNILSADKATIADNQGLGTILNDDARPTIAINDVTLSEGNAGTTTFTFDVTLSNASTETVTVTYQTVNGSATAPADYAAIGATVLTFAPGETSKPVSVAVVGDGAVEPNETFFVSLSAPTNATIATGLGTGTIVNDDVSQTFTVSNVNNDGAGSLRQALADANNNSAPDTINLSPLFNAPQTINLLTALPDITSSVTINGPGAHLLTVRRAFEATTDFRVFNVPLGVPGGVAIRGMTITGGRIPNDGAGGGGIFSESPLTLTNVHVTGNQAINGGGVVLGFSDGVFTGCAFSGNTASFNGGGIFYNGSGGRTLRVVNSTVSGNQAANRGGGIVNSSFFGHSRLEMVGSTVANNSIPPTGGGGISTFTQGAGTTATTTLRNSIVANNTPNNLAAGTFNGGGAATVQTLGFNLSDNYNGAFTPAGTDRTGPPRLAPLSLIGGPTPAHALLGGSPALDAGDRSGETTDQRGQPRPFDTPGVGSVSDGADIGAVEMRSVFVTNANDDGSAGSLRQVIAAAPADGDLLFDPAFFNVARAITLASGELVINKNLHLHGPGAKLLTVSGNNASRVFFIGSGFTASLNGLTITGGNGAGAANNGSGGGILSRGNLTMADAVIRNNVAGNGGGIASGGGTFHLLRGTVSGNTATFQGGGLNLQSANATLTNSTLSGNTANSSSSAGAGVFFVSFGGGFTLQATNCTLANNGTGTANTGGGIVAGAQGATASATALLRNTLIADNALPNLRAATFNGAAATVLSQGFNLASDNGGGFLSAGLGDQLNANPLLAPLGDYGGPTATLALRPGSPARNAAGVGAPPLDQRGFRRVGPPDVGAYEAGTLDDNFAAFIWETLPASATAEQHAANFDFDGDGATNEDEFFAGTVVTDARSVLGVTSVTRSGLNVNVTFPTVPGRVYTFEISTDLVTWTPVAGSVTGDGNPAGIAIGPFTAPRAFVRVLVRRP